MADQRVRREKGSPVHVAVQGSGPLVLLLAGTGQDSSDWQRAGYMASLADRFTVAAIDLPGQGQTPGTADPADYALPGMLGILDDVADHLAAPAFAVIGYSSGGSLALQAASRDDRASLAFVMAATIGRSLDPGTVARSTRQALAVHEAKLAGTLDELPLTPAQRETAFRLDIPAHIAWMHAAMSWPPVHPGDLRCPALLYLGSADQLVPAPAQPPRQPAQRPPAARTRPRRRVRNHQPGHQRRPDLPHRPPAPVNGMQAFVAVERNGTWGTPAEMPALTPRSTTPAAASCQCPADQVT